MLLQDKIAIVSGIGPGMGRDISLRFAEEGANLVLAGRTSSKLEAVAAEVEALGRSALCAPTDITSDEDARKLVASATDAFGRVDVLVNNAFHPGTMTLFEKDDLDGGFRDTIDVNLIGSLRVSQAVIPVMKEQGGGSIVMINTMSIRRAAPGYTAYSASKAGLQAATRGLATELGPHGIRVNSVLPGYIWGPSVEGYFRSRADREGRTEQEIYDEVASEIALRRIPDSREISGAVVFFASELASCTTGASLDVNGGHWMP